MKTLPYEKAFQVALTFAAAMYSRPILAGVLHREDGSLLATDSHRMILLESAHSKDVEQVIDKEGEILPGTFPDTDRIWPQNTEDMEINVDEWLKQHKELLKNIKEIHGRRRNNNRVAILQVNEKQTGFTLLSLENNRLLLEAKSSDRKKLNEEQAQVLDTLSKKVVDYDLPILSRCLFPEGNLAYNIRYMIDMLQAVKKLGHKVCQLKFPYQGGRFSNIAPFAFEAKGIKGLILPIRYGR